MARKIVVASQAGNQARTFETNVTTWGELKGIIGSLYNDGLEAIESIGKTTLSREEASLPEGDFTIFMVAKKNKAGAQTLSDSLYDAIDEAIGDSDIDDEDIDAVMNVVKSTIKTFFSGAVAASNGGNTAAEAAALQELKRF